MLLVNCYLNPQCLHLPLSNWRKGRGREERLIWTLISSCFNPPPPLCKRRISTQRTLHSFEIAFPFYSVTCSLILRNWTFSPEVLLAVQKGSKHLSWLLRPVSKGKVTAGRAERPATDEEYITEYNSQDEMFNTFLFPSFITSDSIITLPNS